MEKRHLDRRLDADGRRGHRVPGIDERRRRRHVVTSCATEFDAIVLAGGATAWRDLPIPGRELGGIHQAMEYLPWSNRVQEGDLDATAVPITADGKHVVIIGGGDTGADCLGTAHRQGAAMIHQFEILPRPPDSRAESTPWPTWPLMFRTSSAHEEGGERVFSVNTECFLGDDDGNVRALRAHEVEMVERQVREDRGHRLRDSVRARPARDGLRRSRASWAARTARRRHQRARQRGARRDVHGQRRWRVRRAATWAAARASSCGPSPRAAAARRASTAISWAKPPSPRRSLPTPVL